MKAVLVIILQIEFKLGFLQKKKKENESNTIELDVILTV